MHQSLINKRFVAAFLAFAILVISTILTINNPTFSAIETAVGGWVYKWPEFLLIPMLLVTQFGNVLFALLLIVVLTIFHKYRLALRVVLAAGLAYLASSILKLVVHRPRPPDFLTDIVSREDLTFGFGFPSGHTALVVAVGLTILPHIPRRRRWIVFAVMAAVAISRIYLGVHAPLDIVGGVCIGILAALGVRSIKRIVPSIKVS